MSVWRGFGSDTTRASTRGARRDRRGQLGSCTGYGDDPWTMRAIEAIRSQARTRSSSSAGLQRDRRQRRRASVLCKPLRA